MRNKNVKSASLPFVIQLSFFILLILSGFVAWVYFTEQVKSKDRLSILQEKNHRSLFLEKIKTNISPKADTISTFKNSRLYGLFNLYELGLDNTKKKIALIGNVPLFPKTGLYLSDKGNSLYLGKNTTLNGEVYVSSSGIRPTNIGYEKEKTREPSHIYTLKKSQVFLPKIASELIQNISTLLQPKLWNTAGNILLDSTLKNSFYEPQLYIEIDTPKTLDNVELIGNIWIRSTAPLTIGANAKISDIIISAPKIYFKKGFKGRLQAFASEQIYVEENCSFAFPSVLWTQTSKKKQSADSFPSLVLESGTHLEGYLGFYPINTSSTNPAIDVKIYPEVDINGVIYCEGLLSMEGRVAGTVFTSGLGVQRQGVLYKNHFVKGQIDASKRSFAALDFSFQQKTNKKVLQWLY